jgi:hypothetical protein
MPITEVVTGTAPPIDAGEAEQGSEIGVAASCGVVCADTQVPPPLAHTDAHVASGV